MLFAVGLIALHAPLLRLPYFWDEAGYYIPAARDLFSGSLIPYSTPSNAHPPLVMAWLALIWKIFGQAQIVTRLAMLLLAAFSLLGFFRLARAIANSMVAACSTLLVAIYPVFFAQSSLAQVDLPAAGLIFWGLEAYLDKDRMGARASSPALIWFALAALAKETAILIPVALIIWELASCWYDQIASRAAAGYESPARKCREGISQIESRRERHHPAQEVSLAETSETLEPSIRTTENRALPRVPKCTPKNRFAGGWMLCLTSLPLALWYAYHYARTGFVFGNPEFFRYNVQSTLHPLRIFLALLLRIWQTFGYLDLYVVTLACVIAMLFVPLKDSRGERSRISIPNQSAFLAIAIIYLVALSIVGGAVLARYMLPVVPLVILVCVSTIWRRLRAWKAVIAVIALAFISALFVNPPYGFSPEDNLAYRDYIRLHQRAEQFLVQGYPNARVLTAWPASDELTRPYLGYVSKPMQVVKIEDFSTEEVLSAADARARFDVALVFSTKYQPEHIIFDRWRRWQEWKSRYFGYHVDLAPDIAASVLGGNVVYVDRRRGQWVGIIQMEKIEEANLSAANW
ncbi:MAG TPA: glycosyltransferase family 39 protein, partial [Terriglobales bacterium]|nr:glycosyltransferase family 39 protein [Terriglobales bacterium]